MGRRTLAAMRTVNDLLAANLHEVFGNRDADKRRAMIEQVYAEDIESPTRRA